MIMETINLAHLEELVNKLREQKPFVAILENDRKYCIEVRNSKLGSWHVFNRYPNANRGHMGFCFGSRITSPEVTLTKDKQGYMLGIATGLKGEGMAVPLYPDFVEFYLEDEKTQSHRARIPLASPLNKFEIIIDENS